MDLNGIIAVTGGILIVLIPVAGLTARFALKPLIETVAKAMQARRGDESVQLMERRLALLEREMAAMRTELQQVSDGHAFDRKLAAGASSLESKDGGNG